MPDCDDSGHLRLQDYRCYIDSSIGEDCWIEDGDPTVAFSPSEWHFKVRFGNKLRHMILPHNPVKFHIIN